MYNSNYEMNSSSKSSVRRPRLVKVRKHTPLSHTSKPNPGFNPFTNTCHSQNPTTTTNSSNQAFVFGASTSGIAPDPLVDNLRNLNIAGGNIECVNNANKGVFVFETGSKKTGFCDDPSMYSKLPDGLSKLNIADNVCDKTTTTKSDFGSTKNVVPPLFGGTGLIRELPDQISNLNIKDSGDVGGESLKFGSGRSVSGDLKNVLPHMFNRLNIKDKMVSDQGFTSNQSSSAFNELHQAGMQNTCFMEVPRSHSVNDIKLETSSTGVSFQPAMNSVNASVDKPGETVTSKELEDRIMAVLCPSQVASSSSSTENTVKKEDLPKIIDDVYRTMFGLKHDDEESITESEHGVLQKIRCLCSLQSQILSPLIECENSDCGVLQHSVCVLRLDFLLDPTGFYCETCRIDRADPFWTCVKNFMSPRKVVLTKESVCPWQQFNITIELLGEDAHILQMPDYDVQVWCLLLNDTVPFRIHWLQYAVLQVNGVGTQTVTRPGSQLLGPNGRDNGIFIKQFLQAGSNKISISACDPRCFVIGIRLVKRRTVNQVLSLIPRELEGETLNNAIERVNHCISGGGTTVPNETELQIFGDSVTVTLHCPVSGVRMKTAGRYKPCVHMACFDLETCIEVNRQSKKWQCPICMKNYSWKDIIKDPYFNQILRTIELSGGADFITEIEIRTNGFWRVKNRPAISNLEKWHCPDGSSCASDFGTTSSSTVNVSSTTTSIDPAEVIVLSSSEEEDDDVV